LVALLARARGIGRGVRGVSGLGVFEAGALDERTLLDLIAWLPAGDFELGCHPGEGVPRVEEDPGWTYGWPRELAALCSHRVRDALAARRVELTTYRGLGSAR
ncbi:MAG TPA: hypothetical protein VEY30_03730, partial [Myxococcaceae bacterium]|nr:hypothetical protein [Myxococcaceae bacterium]